MKLIGALLVAVVAFGLVALVPADVGATGPGWHGKHYDPWRGVG